MLTKPRAPAPFDLEALAEFQIDLGPAFAPPPAAPDHSPQRPPGFAKEKKPRPLTRVNRCHYRSDLALKTWTELRELLAAPLSADAAIDLAVVERVAADLATINSQIVAWLLAEMGRTPPKMPTRAYQRAVVEATARR